MRFCLALKMGDTKKNISGKFYAGIVIAGIVFYVYYGVYKLLFSNFDVFGMDFLRGITAAENFMGGRSIYAMPQQVTPYSYFPAITLLFLPFTSLTGHAAKLVWFFVCHALLLVSFLAIWRYGSRRGALISCAAASGAMLFSTAVFQMLLTGNVNILIFFGLTLVYSALLSSRPRVVPALLAVFSVIKIFPAVLMGLFLRKRERYSAFALFASVLLVFAAVSLAVFGPGNSLEYFRQLPGILRYPSLFHASSLTSVIKLVMPGISFSALFAANLVFFAALTAAWWRAAAAPAAGTAGPGAMAADLFSLTAIMLLVAPASWTMYGALYAMPFYFVLFSMLEGRRDFRFSALFIAIFLFINFWEIAYYHLPLPGGVTARALDLRPDLFPGLYRLVFSGHFAANLTLFGWILVNHSALAVNFERIAARQLPADCAGEGA